MKEILTDHWCDVTDRRPGDDGGRPGHHDGLQPAGHRLREVAENCPVPGGILPGQRVRLPSTLISSQRDGALILSDLAVQIIVKSRPSLEILKNSNSNIPCYHLIL